MKTTNANPLKDLQRFNRNIGKVFDEISKSKRVKRKNRRKPKSSSLPIRQPPPSIDWESSYFEESGSRLLWEEGASK